MSPPPGFSVRSSVPIDAAAVSAFDVSPDGKLAAAGFKDGTLRGDRPALFRGWVREAIARADGILTPAATIRAEEIISGRRHFHAALWRMIAFGAWMRRFDVAVPASADAPAR